MIRQIIWEQVEEKSNDKCWPEEPKDFKMVTITRNDIIKKGVHLNYGNVDISEESILKQIRVRLGLSNEDDVNGRYDLEMLKLLSVELGVDGMCDNDNGIVIGPNSLKKLGLDKYKPKGGGKDSDLISWVNSSAPEVFDYIRQWENFVPYVYDDKYPNKKYVPGTKVVGTLTIGYGTTDPKIIKEYSGKIMTKSEGKLVSTPDIQEAANCVKRWQGDTKDGDTYNRKISKGMYITLIDMVYNLGCTKLRNTNLITFIESGNFKKASEGLSSGWGHEERRESALKLFCKSGHCTKVK
tara:strand:- start:2461 stop:3348 length:888 start_codon:yes stop_codon:yes gene_type:complete